MKKILLALTALIFLAGQMTMAQVQSSEEKNMDKKGMKSEKMMHKQKMSKDKKGMHQGMMGSMMMEQQMLIKEKMKLINNLPEMQEKLDLTDDQLKILTGMRTTFKLEQIDREAEMQKKQMKMKKLVEEDASLEEVRAQMEKCSVSAIDMKMEVIATSRTMMNVLKDEQKAMLQASMDHEAGRMHKMDKK